MRKPSNPPETAQRPGGWTHIVDDGTTWLLRIEWAIMNGRPEPIEMAFRSVNPRDHTKGLPDLANPQLSAAKGATHPGLKYNTQPPFPITASRLRVMGIGKHVAMIRQQFAASNVEIACSYREDGLQADAAVMDASSYSWSAPQQGKALSIEDLQRVADVYRVALSTGEGTHKAVANEFNVSLSTAAKRIMAARRAGLLGPALQSRAGEAESTENI